MNSKKITSYVLPRLIKQGRTAMGQSYEINYENGIKVLNSENTNYSFGSLHQIMLKGITEVLKGLKPSGILMLGLGGGSALSILSKKCSWPYTVKIVEIDRELIELAYKHFGLDTYTNVGVITGDANEVLPQLEQGGFDFIIDDIFMDNRIPDFCWSEEYLMRNASLLKSGGVYMRNTMPGLQTDFSDYEKILEKTFTGFYSVKHATFGNKLYFCHK